MSTKKVNRKRIVYHPPSREAIEAYARKVCERLAMQDTSYLSAEIITGLSRFLRLTADIVAKNLNEKNEVGDKSLANKNK